MIIGNKYIEKSIDSYSSKLVELLERYLNNINREMDIFSQKANTKAKITLRCIIFPNKKEFIADFKAIENDIGKNTQLLIRNYTTWIMQLLGKVAEALVIDACINDRNTNIIFMNIALLRNNIFEEYTDINYDEYVPFSPSYKFIWLEKNGVLTKYNVPDKNPQHTSKDIAWCKKDNILSQMKLNIDSLGYVENAKLQVKASLNYENIKINDNYILTPIIYFDLRNDAEKLKQKYPNNFIISAREINNDLIKEIEMYFKILAAYATGIVDKIDIKRLDVSENTQLEYIFRSNIDYLLYNGYNNDIKEKIIQEAKKYSKPIILEC